MITNCLEAVPESFGELRANPSVNSEQAISCALGKPFASLRVKVLQVTEVHQLAKRLEAVPEPFGIIRLKVL
jgi:hypothetical protein